MNSDMLLLIVIAYSIVCGCYTMVVAEKKGYLAGGWFIAGLLFGIIGLIAAAGLPINSDPQKEVKLVKDEE